MDDKKKEKGSDTVKQGIGKAREKDTFLGGQEPGESSEIDGDAWFCGEESGGEKYRIIILVASRLCGYIGCCIEVCLVVGERRHSPKQVGGPGEKRNKQKREDDPSHSHLINFSIIFSLIVRESFLSFQKSDSRYKVPKKSEGI